MRAGSAVLGAAEVESQTIIGGVQSFGQHLGVPNRRLVYVPAPEKFEAEEFIGNEILETPQSRVKALLSLDADMQGWKRPTSELCELFSEAISDETGALNKRIYALHTEHEKKPALRQIFDNITGAGMPEVFTEQRVTGMMRDLCLRFREEARDMQFSPEYINRDLQPAIEGALRVANALSEKLYR